MSPRLRILVLASGRGSNFQALAEAREGLGVELVALICDRKAAPCLRKAEAAGIPAVYFPPSDLSAASARAGPEARRAYDARLAEKAAEFRPDYILLLGWMRLLSSAFLSRFPGRVINLHPALPGAFPGLRAAERALEAARRGEIGGTGVMLHLVPDEGVDSGPVLATERVPIRPGEELAELEERLHAAERRLVLDLVSRLAGRAAGPGPSEASGAHPAHPLSGGD